MPARTAGLRDFLFVDLVMRPAKPLHVSRIVADRLDSTGATLVAATSDGIWKTFDFGQNWFSGSPAWTRRTSCRIRATRAIR